MAPAETAAHLSKHCSLHVSCWIDQKGPAWEPVFPGSTGEERRGRGQCTLLADGGVGLAADITSKYASSFSCFLLAVEWGVRSDAEMWAVILPEDSMKQSELKWICVLWRWEPTAMCGMTDRFQARSRLTWLHSKDWKEGGMERVWLTGVISSKMIWMIQS